MNYSIRAIFIFFIFLECTRSFGQENLILPYLDGETYGVANSQGDVILDPMPEFIDIDNNLGLIFVRKKRGKEVYNRKGELLLKDIANDCKFSRPIVKSKLVQAVNENSKEIFFILPDSNHISETYDWPGKYSVKPRGFTLELKYPDGSLILDRLGNRVLEEKFKYVENYGYNVHVGNERWNTEYIIVNKGNLILQDAKSLSQKHWSYDIVNHSNGTYLMKNDSVLANFDINNIKYCNDTLVACKMDNKVSIRDFDNNEVLSVLADHVYSPQNSLSNQYYIFKNEKWGIMTLKGDVLIESKYNSITEFGDSGLSIMTDNGLLLVDENLDTINLLKGISAPFYANTKGNLIYVTNENKYQPLAGVINKQGQIILEPFTSGLVETDNKCSVISTVTDEGFAIYNDNGTKIYTNSNKNVSYSCDDEKLMVKLADSSLEISIHDGNVLGRKVKEVKRKKENTWIEEVKCQTGLDSKTKCLKINCGPNEGKVMSMKMTNDQSIKIFNEGKMIISEGFRYNYSSQSTPNLISVTDRESDADEDYKIGLIDYEGNWIQKPTYGEFKTIDNGEYFVFADITTFNTKLYKACEVKEMEFNFDVLENRGFINKTSKTNSKIEIPLIVGKLKNKRELKKALKQIKFKNFEQIKEDLFEYKKPKYEFALYSDFSTKPLYYNMDELSRIDKHSILVNTSKKGEKFSSICDNKGVEMMKLHGELELIYSDIWENNYFTIKRDEFYGVVDVKGNLLVEIEYDSIVKSNLSSVLCLHKGESKYLKLLQTNFAKQENEKPSVKEIYLGKDQYSLNRVSSNFFSVLNESDNSQLILSYDGIYLLKSDYIFNYMKLCAMYPPKGYLYARDPLIKSRSFLVNMKTGQEFRKR